MILLCLTKTLVGDYGGSDQRNVSEEKKCSSRDDYIKGNFRSGRLSTIESSNDKLLL